MRDPVQSLIELWFQPLPPEEIACAKFRELYHDPVLVNGTPLSAADLVARARAQQTAFSELDFHIHERVEANDKLVIAFRQRGRHTGTLVTALGAIPATGQVIERLIIDVLTFREGRISEIRVVGDDLGMLNALGALQLKSTALS